MSKKDKLSLTLEQIFAVQPVLQCNLKGGRNHPKFFVAFKKLNQTLGEFNEHYLGTIRVDAWKREGEVQAEVSPRLSYRLFKSAFD